MQTLKIEATPRADFGKKASRAIRREGQVPCVLYGGGETVSFSVDAKALKPLIYTPNSYIVELTIGGKTEKAVMREVQFHPVREEILHIDFYRVQEGKPVAISIPVRKTIFVGDLKSDNLKFLTPATTAVCAVRVTRASRGAAAEAAQ